MKEAQSERILEAERLKPRLEMQTHCPVGRHLLCDMIGYWLLLLSNLKSLNPKFAATVHITVCMAERTKQVENGVPLVSGRWATKQGFLFKAVDQIVGPGTVLGLFKFD